MKNLYCGSNKNQRTKDIERKTDNAPIKYPNANDSIKKVYPKPPKNGNPYTWNQKEVGIFLASFGMEQYQENFDNEGIDGEQLMSLKKDDYTEIGVYTMGHRKKIQKKVKELKQQYKHKNNNSNHSNSLNNNNNNNSMNSNNFDQNNPYSMNQQFNEQQFLHKNPKQYTKDKIEDKNLYFSFWEQVVSKDFMLEHEYQNLMHTAGLLHKDITIIWKMATSHRQGKCFFEEFAMILKLTELKQRDVPLYLINVSKLIFYHPSIPNFSHNSIPNKNVDKFLTDQVNKNTIAFLNLPISVLESDDRLMELEKLALRKHKPIHFEINQDKLIATFSREITNNDIKALKEQTMYVLTNTMGFNKMLNIKLKRPTKADIAGNTPGGMGPTNNINNNNSNNTGNGIQATNYDMNENIYSNSSNKPHNNNNNLNQYTNNGYNNINNNHIHYDNMHMNEPNSPPPGPPKSPQNNIVGIKSTHNNMDNNGINIDSEQMRQELMMKLLLSDNFWDEFLKRTQIESTLNRNDKIKPKVAAQILAKLRGIQTKDLNIFSDMGVKQINNKTIEKLESKLNNSNVSLNYIANLLGINENDIPEVYVGVVIEGLPNKITDDDDNIRRLDKAVLQDFIVSHIEVVDDTLNISFGSKMTQENIGMLRKYLKKFLKEDIRLEKREMRNVSIIPHTRQTWKRESNMQQMMEYSQ